MTEEDFMSLGEMPEYEEVTEETVDEADEDYGEAEPQEEGAEEGQEPQQQPSEPSEPLRPAGIQPTAAQQAEREALSEEYRNSYNKVNPYTGRIINSPEEFFAYKRRYSEEKARTEAKKQTGSIFEGIRNGTATQEDFDRYMQTMLKNSPDIAAAREAAERVRQAEQRARIDSGKSRMQADIDELNKEYPNCGIKTIADITEPEMIDFIKKGLSIQDAYYLTHREEIIQARQAAARQATINQTAGKAHLKTTTGQAADDEGVTEEMIDDFMPYCRGKSRAEVKEFIKKYGM